MGMNIGPMLKALLGDSAPTDARALELRIGQIVRGVLMEMLDGGDALMNIGGVPVRAKLEADLQIGKGTLLQVQSGGSGGTVVLKPLAEPSENVPDESLKSGLKPFGLPDQKWSYELLRGLKRDGYPIGKETASFFAAAATLKPAGEDAARWMAAADVAFRRGLPSTEETLASLRQSLFGQPLHEELAGFSAALRDWTAGGGATSAKSAELAGRLQALLAEGEQLLMQGEAQLLGEPGKTQTGKPAAASPTPAQPAGTGQAPQEGQAAAPASVAGDARAATGDGKGAAAPQAGAGMPAGERAAAEQPSAPQAVARDAAVAGSAARQEGLKGEAAAPSRPQADAAGNGGQAAQAGAAPREEPAWIGKFLQWLGTGHEHRLTGKLPSDPRPAAGEAPLLPPQPQGEESPGAGAARSAADSLKQALLTLAAHEEAPPVLREAAQSLVHQITGQQLLLSTERQPNQPLSIMTLFVPMKGQDGDTTATVHVQTRRSRKGEWDSDNCRLLFDLRMRHLGDTVVDVQVVDRIVSVRLMNDFPDMAEMAEQTREELDEGLRQAGFQLLSLSAVPLPSLNPDASAADNGETKDKPAGPFPSAYASKPYKGVDFRV